MKKEIKHLIDISQKYGKNKDYTLGGGGNTSYKDKDSLYVKASGYSLADIQEGGFVSLDRKEMATIMEKRYPDDPHEREAAVKEDLMNCRTDPQSGLRPSVEASLHDMISHKFIVHTHPYLVNSLLCSKNAGEISRDLFVDEAVFVPYVDPGYILSKTVKGIIEDYRNKQGKDPEIILLQNHGVFVGADSTGRIDEIYRYLEEKILLRVQEIIKIEPIEFQGAINEIISILDDLLEGNLNFQYRFDTLVAHFTKDGNSISRIDKPFIPDHIVYCKAHPLVIPVEEDQTVSRAAIENFLGTFRQRYGYDPKIVLVEKGPIIAVENNKKMAGLLLDVFEDAMKISFYSNFFGGPKFMAEEEIQFIEDWEVENYRRKISAEK